MDDSSVHYASLSEMQALMAHTCSRPSTAYILFYARCDGSKTDTDRGDEGVRNGVRSAPE